MITWLQHGLLLIHLALFQLVGPVPSELGVHNGALAPCLSPAHCARVDWVVDNPDHALQELTAVLTTTPRTTVIEQANGYLHATASSRLFGFVDDLELYADPVHGVLQARSVSRLGDSDLGVNAQRLASLHNALNRREGRSEPQTRPAG